MKWQPIETAPKDGKRILVWVWPIRKAISVAWVNHFYRGYWTIYHEPYFSWQKWKRGKGSWLVLSPDMQPTHWMPLPEPPEVG